MSEFLTAVSFHPAGRRFDRISMQLENGTQQRGAFTFISINSLNVQPFYPRNNNNLICHELRYKIFNLNVHQQKSVFGTEETRAIFRSAENLLLSFFNHHFLMFVCQWKGGLHQVKGIN